MWTIFFLIILAIGVFFLWTTIYVESTTWTTPEGRFFDMSFLNKIRSIGEGVSIILIFIAGLYFISKIPVVWLKILIFVLIAVVVVALFMLAINILRDALGKKKIKILSKMSF